MPTPPADTIAGAYARGVAEGTYGTANRGDYRADAFAPLNLSSWELRTAIDSWTGAQDVHEHTSYFGAFHIRAMRAYWIGRMRARRQLERYASSTRYALTTDDLERPNAA
jgi:hypothetical protein